VCCEIVCASLFAFLHFSSSSSCTSFEEKFLIFLSHKDLFNIINNSLLLSAFLDFAIFLHCWETINWITFDILIIFVETLRWLLDIHTEASIWRFSMYVFSASRFHLSITISNNKRSYAGSIWAPFPFCNKMFKFFKFVNERFNRELKYFFFAFSCSKRW